MKEHDAIASCIRVRHSGDSYTTSRQLIIEMKTPEIIATWDMR